MAAPFPYHKHAECLHGWAKSELEHVGRIIATEDLHIQKSYAMSTVNGMAHLKDALYEAVNNPKISEYHKEDLLDLHGKVIRVMKHLIDDFNVDVGAIKAFNTEGVLSNLSYLNNNKSRNNSNNNKNKSRNNNNRNNSNNNKNNNNKSRNNSNNNKNTRKNRKH
jgi:hypothetical protein